MADDPKNDPTPDPTEPEGISEDDLRKMIGEEIDSRLTSVTDAIAGIGDSIFDKLKGEGSSDSEGLLSKIGEMIDEKLKNLPSGGNGTAKKEHVPKLRVF